MDEYAIYEYVRNAYRTCDKGFHIPITDDLIYTLVGQMGFDKLLSAQLIAPTSYPGQYVLCCERN